MNADIVIKCNQNGSKLIYDNRLGIEENFQWLKSNFKNVHFKGRLAAELFVAHCNKSTKCINSSRRHNVLNYSCSLGKLLLLKLLTVIIQLQSVAKYFLGKPGVPNVCCKIILQNKFHVFCCKNIHVVI